MWMSLRKSEDTLLRILFALFFLLLLLFVICRSHFTENLLEFGGDVRAISIFLFGAAEKRKSRQHYFLARCFAHVLSVARAACFPAQNIFNGLIGSWCKLNKSFSYDGDLVEEEYEKSSATHIVSNTKVRNLVFAYCCARLTVPNNSMDEIS